MTDISIEVRRVIDRGILKERRLELHFAAASKGPERLKFLLAYRALRSLDPHNPADRAAVQNVAYAHDPVKALFDWFEGFP